MRTTKRTRFIDNTHGPDRCLRCGFSDWHSLWPLYPLLTLKYVGGKPDYWLCTVHVNLQRQGEREAL